MTTLAEFETFVIEDVVKCDALINSTLSGVKFVGFDCEWIAKGKISLIQISTENKVLLFRLNKMPVITELLESVLEDESVMKFGVDIARDGDKLFGDHKVKLAGKVDLRKLIILSKPYVERFWKQIQGFETDLSKKKQFNPRFLLRFDTSEERRKWRPRNGLKALSTELLDIEMDKKMELRAGNWNRDVLSSEQIHYAALDAWVALQIARCLASPSLNAASAEKGTLLKLSEVVKDRIYSEKTDHAELLKLIHKEHPEFKMKDYIPGKQRAPLTRALQKRLNKEQVMQQESEDEDGDMPAIRQEEMVSQHQQECY